MSVYLDTHVVSWLAANRTKKFPPKALKIIDSSDLIVSPMVLVELQYLFEINRLGKPPQVLLDQLKTHLGLEVSHYSFPSIAQAAVFETWTRDVFDRVIVAQARSDGYSALISADLEIQQNYSKTVWD